MKYDRPIVLSIAGFDPTGGAGVLADIKTFEQHNVLGMGVITAQTVQTENQFLSVKWMNSEDIIHQLTPIMHNYDVKFVKIGMIENLKTLWAAVSFLKKMEPELCIVWDPVLTSSSGFELVNQIDDALLKSILSECFLITPNLDEIKILSANSHVLQGAQSLSKYCAIYVKGGHSTTEQGVDNLFQGNKITKLYPHQVVNYSKHGSGCILSSAILSNLTHSKSIEIACQNAKKYIEKILNSNPNLLAYHS